MKIKNVFRIWLPFAVVTTAFCALVYVSAQQVLRQGLNDPQIQMAEDGADALNNGSTIESILPQQKVSFDKSLAPFIVVYDSDGLPLSGSGTLDGQLPAIPKGVLDSAKQNDENRVTWQPSSDVRVAAVMVPYKNGFVLAGRNMREVEGRELQVEGFAGATWALTLVVLLVVIAFGETMLADNK